MSGVTFDFGDAKKSLEKALLKRYKRLLSAKDVEVGFFPEHTHPEAGVPVAQVAAWQEWGTPNAPYPSPPRPFFRYTIANYSAEWGEILRVSLKASDYDAKAALTALGQLAVQRLQGVIKAWSEPPNTPATARAKGFNDPLIETQYMLRHVTYKVNTK